MPDDGNRYELIEGEIFVSRSPSLTHQSVSGNIFLSIKAYLIEKPIGEIWATPGVIFSEFSGVIPDLVFVSHQRRNEIASGDRITGAPDLVIEIVSPGAENERRDRLAKRQLYGKHGVKEYWIVDFEKRTIEVYLLQAQILQLQSAFTEKDELTSSVLPGYRANVETILSV
jgi:Uma2 family endonuclease